jgi:hypothetical protein
LPCKIPTGLKLTCTFGDRERKALIALPIFYNTLLPGAERALFFLSGGHSVKGISVEIKEIKKQKKSLNLLFS